MSPHSFEIQNSQKPTTKIRGYLLAVQSQREREKERKREKKERKREKERETKEQDRKRREHKEGIVASQI